MFCNQLNVFEKNYNRLHILCKNRYVMKFKEKAFIIRVHSNIFQALGRPPYFK